MAEYYRDEPPNNRIASFPQKTVTRYTALGNRQELLPTQAYTQRDLEESGFSPSRRAIATVSVTETHPWETVFDRGDWFPADEDTGQLRMMSPNPGKTEVGALVSDPSMRSSVPTLLALATQGKQNVTHDHWLSQHSSRLINKVRGQVDIQSPDTNPTAAPGSEMDKNVPWVGTYAERDGVVYGTELFHTDAKLEKVPDLHVRVAKDTVRSVLRGRKLSPQFDAHVEQLQLPGLEE